jgi:hypothetical protein
MPDNSETAEPPVTSRTN